MNDKTIKDENLDEIIKNVVKDIKNDKEISKQDIEKLISDANENIEFSKVIEDIKLASPDNRVIFVDGNEELVYDHGEFFMCDTVDSRKPRKKVKRKEATEKYIEYFIRYQLNPIIEQKQIYNMTKTITKEEVIKAAVPKVKSVDKTVVNKEKESVKTVKAAPKKEVKTKEGFER